MMILYQKFFEAALLDFMAAWALTERAHFPPVLYHLQQAYEKCIKSYFIFKELNIKKTSEAAAYQCIRKLGHDTQEWLFLQLPSQPYETYKNETYRTSREAWIN